MLAKTFARCIDNSTFLTKELKIEFCAILLSAIVDSSYQPKTTDLTKKLKNKSVHSGIKLLKRYPRKGIEVLVDLIMFELIYNQNYTQDDLFQFYSEIFSCFFERSLVEVSE